MLSEPERPEPSPCTAFVFWMTGALVLTLLLAAWQALPALLLAFASVIFAVMLHAVARPLQLYLGLSPGWSLPVAGAIILAVPVAGVLLIGPELRTQLADIGKAIPAAVEKIGRDFDIDFETLLKEITGTRSHASQEGRGQDVDVPGEKTN